MAMAGLEALADELRAASGGEVDIRVIPPRRLAGAADTLDAMASGLIDGHYSSPAYFAARDPAFALLGDTLALYPDPETRDRWYGRAAAWRSRGSSTRATAPGSSASCTGPRSGW
ncbi:MAG: hypothetical protein M5U33_03950 [Pseudorhodoplanes sp.]|nr:hypothetical protein [Pseudorhodoplanes sp.]